MKKQFLSILIAVAMLFSVFNGVVLAETNIVESGSCGDNLSWSLNSDGLLTIEGNGNMSNWSQSSTAPWYNYRQKIKSVIIDNGVTNIGTCAFRGLYLLSNAEIASSVTMIANYAFQSCNKLTTLTIPDSVTNIGNYAFESCSKLTALTLPDNVTSLGNYALSRCSSLKSITIGSGISDIPRTTFDNCTSLSKIYVSENNQFYSSDENGILYNKNKTTLIKYPPAGSGAEYIIPNTITSINSYAFDSCSSLTNIYIPGSVLNIGEYAFDSCTSLKSVSIENGVTSIGGYAFYNCKSLTSAVIPNSVVSIGNYLFNGCSSLLSVKLGRGVSYVNGQMFSGCSVLSEIYVDSDNAEYSSDENGILFNKNKTILVRYPSGKTQIEYTVPSTISTIESYAFNACNSLIKVTIPNSVTTIGSNAFGGCRLLTSVKLPFGITSIPTNLFTNCISLKEVLIPGMVTVIYEYAFRECTALSAVSIPVSVKRIGRAAFLNCTSLSAVYYSGGESDWETINIAADNTCITTDIIHYEEEFDYGNDNSLITGYIGENITWTFDSNETLTVNGNGDMPDWSDSSSVPWNSYRNNIKKVIIGNGISNIGDYAFYNCRSVSSVTISGTVTSIGNRAFESCNLLNDITIPHGVTDIGISAFRGCSALTSISIPDSVLSIGNSAFSECNSLLNVTLGNGVKNIDVAAFSDCASLTTVSIGSSVESIGVRAFFACNSLEKITVHNDNAVYSSDDNGVLYNKDKSMLIQYPLGNSQELYTVPDTVTEIGDMAFYGNRCLNSITISDSVKTIGTSVFGNCTALYSVFIGSGVETIGNRAFAYCETLNNITVDKNNTSFISDEQGVLYSKDKTSLKVYPSGNVQTYYEIPNGVVNIDSYAFFYNETITQIKIPNTVKDIGEYAFGSIYSLTDVYYVGTEEEWNSINISSYNDILKWVAIHFVEEETEPSGTFGDGFSWNISDNILYVDGNGAMTDWMYLSTDVPWYPHIGNIQKIVVGEGITSIGSNAFHSCSALKKVVIPESLKIIGYNVFNGCTALEEVKLPDNILSIWGYAFENCTSLKNVETGDGITGIGEYAFSGCISLESITIGNALVSVGKYAFDNCTSLAKVYYNGTHKDWSAVSIGNANDALINADIEFLVVPPVELTLSDYTYDGENITVSLSISNLTQDYKAYAAIYSSESEMKQVNKITLTEDSSGYNMVTIPASKLIEGDITKIFVFDSETGIKPLCKNITFKPVAKTVKLNGMIVETCKYGNLAPNRVSFKINDTYGSEEYEAGQLPIYVKVAEGTDVDKYFGMSVDITLTDGEITAINPDEFNNVATLNIEDIDGADTDDSQIVYYPSPTSGKTSRYKLNANAVFLYNYKDVSGIEKIIYSNGSFKDSYEISFTLIDNNGDNYYDIVIAKEYIYDIITGIDSENTRFETANGSIISFDFEDPEIIFDFKDKNVNSISFKDFEVGDTIAYISDNGSSRYYNWIEIINLKNSGKVSGTITATSDDYVYINGIEYFNLTAQLFNLGDNGIFYTTLNGKIFYFEEF